MVVLAAEGKTGLLFGAFMIGSKIPQSPNSGAGSVVRALLGMDPQKSSSAIQYLAVKGLISI